MKKVLIISYLFAPKSAIGAIRWTKIAKYLGQRGIITDIITRTEHGFTDDLLENDLAKINGKIHRVAHSDYVTDTAPSIKLATTAPVAASIKGPVNRIKRSKLVRSIREHLKKRKVYKSHKQNYMTGVDFCNQAVDYMRSNNIVPTEYDAVISSFGPVGCALLALRLKELYPDMRLIMDFRDPMVNYLQCSRMNSRLRSIQQKLCILSDSVLTVSKGCAHRIGEGKLDDNIKVIYNGYDTDDLSFIADGTADRFSFCFTGSLYDGKMDVSPLFESLANLISANTIKREDIVFNYAGRDFAVLAAQAQKYGVGDILCDHGQLPRRECLNLQRNSRHLVFCSWNLRDNEGVLTGKVFEYMLMRRPMIGLVSGNIPQSEIRSLIENIKGGIVFEQADRKKCMRTLTDHLKTDYDLFTSGKDSNLIPDSSAISIYDYKNIAAQIAEMI